MISWPTVAILALPSLIKVALGVSMARALGLTSSIAQFAFVVVLIATLSMPMRRLNDQYAAPLVNAHVAPLVNEYVMLPLREWRALRAARKALEQDPDYAALLRRYPDRRDWFLATMLRADLDDKAAALALAEVVDWQRTLVGGYVGRTSDVAAREFALDAAGLLLVLSNHSSDGCTAVLDGRSVTAAVEPLGSKEIKLVLGRLVHTTARVIRDAIDHPQPVPSEAWVRDTLTQVQQRAEAQGLSELRDPLDPTTPPRDACRSLMAIYELAYKQLPEPDFHALLRGGFALYFNDPSI